MFDTAALRSAIATHGPVARVVIAQVAGSSPREMGAAMLVWPQGQSGTIGGGALEFQAAARARAMLVAGKTTPRLDHEALGPSLGQCCGGTVTLLTEVFHGADLPESGLFARGIDGSDMPLAVSRLLAQARGQGMRPTALVQNWMVEPVRQPTRHIWVWGAGHVGRALVHTLAPLPDIAITWVDVSPDRFPAIIPNGVTMLPAADPARLMPHAPQGAEHLILTYSHTLDLALCHAALTHGFARCGLIGSKTKWARFRSRLAALGHSVGTIAQINCPIGNTGLGKHPQAIAIGVACQVIQNQSQTSQQENVQ